MTTMSTAVPICITDLRSDIPAVIKHDDDTKRTVPLCEEEDDTDHMADPSRNHDNNPPKDSPIADNDDDDDGDEDSEISSLGGLEDGFDVQATLESFDEAAASHTLALGEYDDDDDIDEELSTGVPRRIVADHALSPRVSPIAVPPTPSFNEFLKQRKSILDKNVDYLCNASQRSSFAEEPLELFSRNVQYLLGKANDGAELEEGKQKEQSQQLEEDEPSFLEARWSTFSRNLQFIGSQITGDINN